MNSAWRAALLALVVVTTGLGTSGAGAPEVARGGWELWRVTTSGPAVSVDAIMHSPQGAAASAAALFDAGGGLLGMVATVDTEYDVGWRLQVRAGDLVVDDAYEYRWYPASGASFLSGLYSEEGAATYYAWVFAGGRIDGWSAVIAGKDGSRLEPELVGAGTSMFWTLDDFESPVGVRVTAFGARAHALRAAELRVPVEHSFVGMMVPFGLLLSSPRESHTEQPSGTDELAVLTPTGWLDCWCTMGGIVGPRRAPAGAYTFTVTGASAGASILGEQVVVFGADVPFPS